VIGLTELGEPQHRGSSSGFFQLLRQSRADGRGEAFSPLRLGRLPSTEQRRNPILEGPVCSTAISPPSECSASAAVATPSAGGFAPGPAPENPVVSPQLAAELLHTYFAFVHPVWPVLYKVRSFTHAFSCPSAQFSASFHSSFSLP